MLFLYNIIWLNGLQLYNSIYICVLCISCLLPSASRLRDLLMSRGFSEEIKAGSGFFELWDVDDTSGADLNDLDSSTFPSFFLGCPRFFLDFPRSPQVFCRCSSIFQYFPVLFVGFPRFPTCFGCFWGGETWQTWLKSCETAAEIAFREVRSFG